MHPYRDNTTSSFDSSNHQSQAPEDASHHPECPLTSTTLACNSSPTANLTRRARRDPLWRYNPHGKLSNHSNNGAGLHPPTAHHPQGIIKPHKTQAILWRIEINPYPPSPPTPQAPHREPFPPPALLTTLTAPPLASQLAPPNLKTTSALAPSASSALTWSPQRIRPNAPRSAAPHPPRNQRTSSLQASALTF